ncbi:hypothetical protein AC138_19585 [Pseudomonas putida]|jgi:hypothetical protein|nr:hypothetical protein AC138_19585 [Pseudomonas putida]KMY31091.1 hypothetical protein AA993_19690 [Pseudomonas putida]
MDGLPVTQVSTAAPEASAVIVGGRELARFDTELNHWVLNVESQKKKQIFPKGLQVVQTIFIPATSTARLPTGALYCI